MNRLQKIIMKYEKGQRIEITKCDDYLKNKYNYDVGFTGVINEDVCLGGYIPFIKFDEQECNYTSKGTAVSIDEFKIIDNEKDN